MRYSTYGIFMMMALLLAACGREDSLSHFEDLAAKQTAAAAPARVAIATAVPLEGAKNIDNGLASFGDRSGDENDEDINGFILRADDGTRIGDLYSYGQPLTPIYDTGDEGPLADGRYIRIVVGQENIVKTLGLTPICRDFSSGPTSPPRNECHIDPLRGQFSLPRPSYWSRMENLANMTNSVDIGLYDPFVTGDPGSFVFVKFNNGYHQPAVPSGGANRTNGYIYPYGNRKGFDKGTLSCWFKMGAWSQADYLQPTAIMTIMENASICVQITGQAWVDAGYIRLYINGSENWSQALSVNVIHHLYVIWDIDGSFIHEGSSGYTVKMFINNTLATAQNVSFTSTGTVTPVLHFSSVYANFGVQAAADCYMENLQMWEHVVSENPAWLYNSGAGREDALHVIYGAANNYRPALTGSGNGVGYYYLP